MSAPTAEWNLLCEFASLFAQKCACKGRCGHRPLRRRRSVVRKYDRASAAGWGHPALRKIWDWGQQLSLLRRAGAPKPAAAGSFDFGASRIETRAAARGDSFRHGFAVPPPSKREARGAVQGRMWAFAPTDETKRRAEIRLCRRAGWGHPALRRWTETGTEFAAGSGEPALRKVLNWAQRLSFSP